MYWFRYVHKMGKEALSSDLHLENCQARLDSTHMVTLYRARCTCGWSDISWHLKHEDAYNLWDDHLADT